MRKREAKEETKRTRDEIGGGRRGTREGKEVQVNENRIRKGDTGGGSKEKENEREKKLREERNR